MSAADTGMNDFLAQSSFITPLRGRHCAPVVGQKYATAAVVGLRFPRSPFAVAGLVIAVVVKALNRHSFRTRPHVGVEVLERVTPTIANGDSTRPVTKIGVAVLVVASLKQRAIDAILGRPCAAMRALTRASASLTKAAAAFGATYQESVFGRDRGIATVAQARKIKGVPALMDGLNNQSSKPLANERARGGMFHGGIINQKVA